MIIRRIGLVAAAFLIVAPVSATAQRAQPALVPDDGWGDALMTPAPPLRNELISSTRVDAIRPPKGMLPRDDPDQGYSLGRYVAVGAGLGALGAAIWTGVSLLRYDGHSMTAFTCPMCSAFRLLSERLPVARSVFCCGWAAR